MHFREGECLEDMIMQEVMIYDEFPQLKAMALHSCDQKHACRFAFALSTVFLKKKLGMQ